MQSRAPHNGAGIAVGWRHYHDRCATGVTGEPPWGADGTAWRGASRAGRAVGGRGWMRWHLAAGH